MTQENLDIRIRLQDLASAGVSRVRKSLGEFSESANIAKKNAEDVQKKFEGIGTIGKTVSIGAGAVATALGFLGKTALVAAGQYEQNRIAFKGLLGTYEEADRVLTKIEKIAAETPFETASLTSMAQQLTTITKDGDKAVDVLLAVGDAVAKSGKNVVEMERVVLNLQQVASTGKVTELDIREFQRAIPLFNDIIASAGLTTEKLKESKNASELLFGAFRKASEEGGIAFGGLAEQSKSLNGRISTLKDNFGIFFRQIGDALMPVVKPIIDGLIAMTNGFSKLSPSVKTAIAIIGGGVFILTSLLTVLGGIAFILPTIASGMGLLGISVKGLIAGTGIGALAVAVGSLSYAIYANWDAIKAWSSGISSFFIGGVKTILIAIDTLIKKFNEFAKKTPLIPTIDINVSGAIAKLDELQNKLKNASKTIKSPTITTTTKTKNVLSAVAVEDNGKGQKAQEKAFKKHSDTLLDINKDTVNKMKDANTYSMESELANLEKLRDSHKLTADDKLKITTKITKLKEDIRQQEIDKQLAQENQMLATKKNNLQLTLDQERGYLANRLNIEGLDEQQRAEIRNRLNQIDLDIAQQKQETDQYAWSEEQRIMFEREQLKMKGISTELQLAKIVLDSARTAGTEKLSIEKQIAQGALDFAKKGIVAEVDALAGKWAVEATARIASSWGTDVGAWGLLAIASGASAGIRSSMNGIQLAEGGIVMPQAGGVRATVAEAGQPEAVIPLGSNEAQSMIGGGASEQRVIILDSDGVTTLAKGIIKKADYLKKTGQVGLGL